MEFMLLYRTKTAFIFSAVDFISIIAWLIIIFVQIALWGKYRMTTSAREVLVYCNLAAKRLKEISFDDTQDWRLGWITILTLLRAVGHVFDKVDKSQYDLSYRNKIKEYWKKKKAEPIFK